MSQMSKKKEKWILKMISEVFALEAIVKILLINQNLFFYVVVFCLKRLFIIGVFHETFDKQGILELLRVVPG